MATDTGADPYEENARLRGRVVELETRLRELEGQRQAEQESVRRVGWFGLKVFVGGDLRGAFRTWIDAKTLRDPLPSAETAELAAALVRRMVRVSLIGLAVAVLPTALLVWQNLLFREQLDQQSRDTTIVRRAQLLATIYDCLEPPTHIPPFLRWSDIATCPPAAHERARHEAIVALAEIERNRGEALNLHSADLSGLRLERVDLRRANLGLATLRGTRLRRANLREAYLRRADISQADLSEADLSGATIDGATLERARLRGAVLVNAKIQNSDLQYADLKSVDLRWADLTAADLRYGQLQGADLRGTNFREADLRRADLSSADLRGATLDQQQLNETARGNATTRIPAGLIRPAHWSSRYE